jgi:serine/threonine protein kinase/tetratricopeptide (TPR) repeat protein
MQEQSIFIEALEREDGSARAGFLDQACAGDASLRERIERLLHQHKRAEGFLESYPADPGVTADCPLGDNPGTLIGPYKLLEQIGEGGFGVVFMAEQQAPIRRRVALKILKPGMDTKQVIARFEAERQALALMDHPNIAKVLDAGQTSSGRPYFVMDLVKGLPITEYCDQAQLSPKERMDLFVAVCQAVQHAHQKGIIHRDIKPTNVLVTLHDGTPVPKIIDFGIAKALGQQLTDRTLYTGFAQLIGTPLYMSPEQAALSGQDVDTRSDIYSLGVLLYELLTGTTPFDKVRLGTADYDEIRRIIREEEPPKPSTRVSTLGQASTTISTQRKSEPKQLSRLLRGELDWIVMKALEKDRNRRYETVSAFAADVRHYLQDEPVTACPPSRLYRFRKFARRHRGAIAVAAAMLVMIAAVGAGVAGGIGYAARDRAARETALDEAVSREIKEAERLLESAHWSEAESAAERAAKLLASAGRHELPARLLELQADLATAVHLEEIYSRPKSEDFGARREQDAEYARTFRDCGIDLVELTTHDAALRIRARSIRTQLTRALDIWSGMRRRSGNKGAPTWKHLLEVAQEADPDEWRDKLRGALAREDLKALETLAATPPIRELPAGTLHLLGTALSDLGAHAQAVALLRQAQRQYPDDLWINSDLGWISLNNLKKFDDAVRFYTADLAIRPHNMNIRWALGYALGQNGSYSEGAEELSKVIEEKPDWAKAWAHRGDCYRHLGQWVKAISDYSKAIELNPSWADPRDRRGDCYKALEQWENAIADYSKAIELDPKSARPRDGRGECYRALKQWDKAIDDYTKAIDLDSKIPEYWSNRGSVYWDIRQFDEAISNFSKAIELNPKAHWAFRNRGTAYKGKRQWRNVIADWSKAVELEPDNVGYRNDLAWLLATCIDVECRDPGRAVELAAKAVELKPKDGNLYNTLGVACYRAGDWNGAIEALEKSMKLQGDNAFDRFFLAMAHWRLTKKDEALKCYERAVEWLEKNRPTLSNQFEEELSRIRAEAKELLNAKD